MFNESNRNENIVAEFLQAEFYVIIIITIILKAFFLFPFEIRLLYEFVVLTIYNHFFNKSAIPLDSSHFLSLSFIRENGFSTEFFSTGSLVLVSDTEELASC